MNTCQVGNREVGPAARGGAPPPPCGRESPSFFLLSRFSADAVTHRKPKYGCPRVPPSTPLAGILPGCAPRVCSFRYKALRQNKRVHGKMRMTSQHCALGDAASRERTASGAVQHPSSLAALARVLLGALAQQRPALGGSHHALVHRLPIKGLQRGGSGLERDDSGQLVTQKNRQQRRAQAGALQAPSPRAQKCSQAQRLGSGAAGQVRGGR